MYLYAGETPPKRPPSPDYQPFDVFLLVFLCLLITIHINIFGASTMLNYKKIIKKLADCYFIQIVETVHKF